MGFFDKLLRPEAKAASTISIRDLIAKAQRGRASTAAALGTQNKDGFDRPVHRGKQYVGLVTREWMTGTAVDKIVAEVTKEGYSFQLKDKQLEKSREKLERKELKSINEILACPTEDEYGGMPFSMKDVLKSIAWYHVVTGSSYTEIQPDELGRPTRLTPLPSEYMGKRPSTQDVQMFCPVPGCYTPDIYFDVRREICPKCGGMLIPTVWVMFDDNEKVVARWGKGEIIEHQTRAYGGRNAGVPVIERVWYVAQILRWMERYQYSSYANNTSANKIIACPDMTQGEVDSMFTEIAATKAASPSVRRNLALGVKQPPVVIDMLDSLVDLDARNLAEFYREAIGINLGVSLNLLGVQSPGKLGKETETIEVSFDTIMERQAEIEDLINHRILPLFKEISSFKFELGSPKKDDELRKAQIENTRAMTLGSLRRSGADAILNEDGKIEIASWISAERLVTIRDDDVEPIGGSELDVDANIAKMAPRNLPALPATAGISKAEQRLDSILTKASEQAAAKIGRTQSAHAAAEAAFSALDEMRRMATREAVAFQKDYYAEVLERGAAEGDWDDDAFMMPDLNALDWLNRQPDSMFNALSNYTEKQRDGIWEVMRNAEAHPEDFTLEKIKKALSEVVVAPAWKLASIARTETGRISTLAHRTRWEKVRHPDDRFKFINAHDDRVCVLCDAIANGGEAELDGVVQSFHGNPYTWDEMVKISPSGPLHPGDRCLWGRIPKSLLRGVE